MVPASAGPSVTVAAGGWRVERWRGSAAVFHAREVVAPVHRSLWLLQVDRPALVLGSAQRDDIAGVGERAAAHGIEVVRRRSGGSAVLLEPGAMVWADLVIGRDDPLWDDDVGRATWWVGRCWQEALAGLGIEAAVHRGPMQRSRWSDRICFAGLGPGEVTVAGRKVVGLSQRRTRTYARFQTSALLRWEPALLAGLCGVVAVGEPVAEELTATATGIDRSVTAVEDALLAALPA